MQRNDPFNAAYARPQAKVSVATSASKSVDAQTAQPEVLREVGLVSETGSEVRVAESLRGGDSVKW